MNLIFNVGPTHPLARTFLYICVRAVLGARFIRIRVRIQRSNDESSTIQFGGFLVALL